MRSPYHNFQNATITFHLPVAAGASNSVGNFKVVTKPLVVKTYMAQVHVLRYKRPENVPDNAIAYECHAVEPMILPPELRPGVPATVVMGEYETKFTLHDGIINPPYGHEGMGAIMERAQGTFFVGWLLIDAYNG